MITKQSLLEALNLEKLSVTLTHIMSALKGPYTIVQKITDITYRVQSGPRSQPFVCHVDNLRPYTGENVPTWYKM